MEWHLASGKKDGKETNPAISKPLPDMEFGAFLPGLEPSEGGGFGMFRKYWKMIEKK